MESYTHQEYIAALKMSGKEPPVTPEKLEQQQKRQQELGRAQQDRAASKKVQQEEESAANPVQQRQEQGQEEKGHAQALQAKHSLEERWFAEIEGEEIERERVTRARRKEKAKELEDACRQRARATADATKSRQGTQAPETPAKEVDGPEPAKTTADEASEALDKAAAGCGEKHDAAETNSEATAEQQPQQRQEEEEGKTSHQQPKKEEAREDDEEEKPSSHKVIEAVPGAYYEVGPFKRTKSVTVDNKQNHYSAAAAAAAPARSTFQVSLHWVGLVDLDLSCVSLNGKGKRTGFFFFGENSVGNAFAHSGDMLAGPAPDGVSERITVNLGALDSEVHVIYFLLTCYSDADLGKVEELSVSLDFNGEASSFYSWGEHSMARAIALCRVFRKNEDGWMIQYLNDLWFKNGDTVRAVVGEIEKHFTAFPA